MKNRTKQYFKKSKARKIFQHPLQSDLKTFLNAAMELCRSRIVKHHVQEVLVELDNPQYRLSA